MHAVWSIALIVGSTTLGGCVADDIFRPSSLADFSATADQTVVTAPAPVPSPMPWQLTPASTASIAQGERTIVVANIRFGKVKGTPLAVANLDKPVVAFARRGRVVTACRQVIEPQAKSIGAYSVQAAAAGPETKNDGGDRTQQVFFRIIYERPDFLEVRQAALVCTLDTHDRVVDAHPV